jgi:hypothetical protein
MKVFGLTLTMYLCACHVLNGQGLAKTSLNPRYLLDSLAIPQNRQSVMLQKWDANQLPFFCKWEHKLGAKLPVPVLFRLGSVEYVNWLEQKGGASANMPFVGQ